MLEIMEDSLGGMTDKLRVEQGRCVARQLHRHHVRRVRNAFARRHFEEQAIRGKRNHCFPSSFFTSCTKSVASWKRRYTLAKRTYATSSVTRRLSMTSLPITSAGTSRSYLSVTSLTIFSIRSSMTLGLIGRFWQAFLRPDNSFSFENSSW